MLNFQPFLFTYAYKLLVEVTCICIEHHTYADSAFPGEEDTTFFFCDVAEGGKAQAADPIGAPPVQRTNVTFKIYYQHHRCPNRRATSVHGFSGRSAMVLDRRGLPQLADTMEWNHYYGFKPLTIYGAVSTTNQICRIQSLLLPSFLLGFSSALFLVLLL